MGNQPLVAETFQLHTVTPHEAMMQSLAVFLHQVSDAGEFPVVITMSCPNIPLLMSAVWADPNTEVEMLTDFDGGDATFPLTMVATKDGEIVVEAVMSKPQPSVAGVA